MLNFRSVNAQVFLGNDTSICNFQPYLLDAGPGYVSYLWSTGSTNQTISVVTGGQYWVFVQDTNTIFYSDTINILMSLPPASNFEFVSECRFDTVQFLDFSFSANVPIVIWTWDFGDGNTSNDEEPSHAYDTDGDFDVTLITTTQNGCADTITKTIAIYPLPIIDAGTDALINAGDTIIINATAPPGDYFWLPASFIDTVTLLNPKAYPPGTITYILHATDTNGCANSDTITIFVNQRPNTIFRVFNINPNTSLIVTTEQIATDPDGDSLSLIITQQPGNGTAVVENGTIVYTPDENFSGVDTVYFTVCDTGNPPLCRNGFIIVNVGNIRPDANNDFIETEINISVQFNVMENDTEYNANQTIVIDFVSDPPNGSVVDLNNGDLLYTPDFSFVGVDSFFYIICDDGQPILCDTAWVFVTVKAFPLFIHNAFSPNGDGVFDFFIIEGIRSYPESELSIFNRWGEIVYRAKGYQNDWDGFTGFKEELPEATYFYHLDLKDGTKPYTGYLILKR